MTEKGKLYISIDAGGTFLKSAVIRDDGIVLEGTELKTPSRSDGSLAEIIGALGVCIASGLSFAEKTGCPIQGIGLSIPGPFDYHNGISLMEHKFKSLYNVNLKAEIRKLPGIHSHIPIRFIHDANAVLLGEQLYGNAQPYENAAVVTLGTGIGFTHSQNRMIQCNSLGAPLVSIYRNPCNDGILEDYISRRGIVNMFREIVSQNGYDAVPDLQNITVQEIGELADAGDRSSIATFQRMGVILSESLSDILQQKQIDCLLLGGQISRSFTHFEKSLKDGLRDVTSLKCISSVEHIDNAAFYGILAHMRK